MVLSEYPASCKSSVILRRNTVMTLSPFLVFSALRPSTQQNERKCHNWAIKKQPPKKLPNGSYVVDFILFFIAFICLFAFKFPRSGLVQLVIDRFTRARELVICP